MDLIAEFFRHNTMMNRRLVDACRGLDPGQLASTTPGTFGSIVSTLRHLANSQVGYTARLGADRPEPLAADAGMDAIAERIDLGNALLQEAAGAADAGHQIEVSGDDPPGTWRMPAALLLLQAVNHATEHRSQVATILTQIGVEPPEMSGWTYCFDSGQMTEV